MLQTAYVQKHNADSTTLFVKLIVFVSYIHEYQHKFLKLWLSLLAIHPVWNDFTKE